MLSSKNLFAASSNVCRALVVLLVFTLFGCNFKLRGTDSATYTTNPIRVHVSANVPDLKHSAVVELRNHGYLLDSNQPEVVVQIKSESISEFDEGFDVDFTTKSKTLSYSTEIVFIQDDGTILWGPETLSFSIHFTDYKGNEQVSQSTQRDALQKARNRAATQITRQLNLILNNLAGNKAPASN